MWYNITVIKRDYGYLYVREMSFMKTTIIGRKCTLRDSFKERAEKKLAKIEKLFGEEAEAKVTATAEKSIKIVEITVYKNGMIFRAEERSQDMIDALDDCVDTLIRKIRKNKTRIEKKLRDVSFDDIVAGADEKEDADYEVVRTKEVELKPQLVEEAILQMNLLGHQFYMFLNGETNEVNVLYKRGESGYGIIIPKTE